MNIAMTQFPQRLAVGWPTQRWMCALILLLAAGPMVRAGDAVLDSVDLPPLRVLGQPAEAHTQGLEVLNGFYYVTARREDVRPRRALLLRTASGRSDWDVWDITPAESSSNGIVLDHPGGFQSDGRRLWIPVSESRRNGRTMIRVFPLAGLKAGTRLEPEREFPAEDHIGALAVDVSHELVFGASWDTETVLIWDFAGRLQRTLAGAALEQRGLGVAANDPRRVGLAVQDWKIIGSRLIASGLLPAAATDSQGVRSRLVLFDRFPDPDFRKREITLPVPRGVELAREAMALSEGTIWFLPQDLGASNRLFRLPLAELDQGRAGKP